MLGHEPFQRQVWGRVLIGNGERSLKLIGMFCDLIIPAMSGSPSFSLADQSTPPHDRDNQERENSYLGVYAANVFVRDQDRSLRFYVDQLGFSLAFDVRLQSGERWVGVAPPHGTAVLTLIAPDPESDEYKRIGQPTPIAFVSDDVVATYSQWRRRGVRFRHVPRLRRVKYQQLAADGVEILRRCCWASRHRSGAAYSPASKISTGIPSPWSASTK